MKLSYARTSCTAESLAALKGHGFSRAANRTSWGMALATEGMLAMENPFPRGLKPNLPFGQLAAGLKPSPFKTAALVAAIVFNQSALYCSAQTAPDPPPAAQQATPAPPDQPHQGKVIFSRSTDENGQTTTTRSGPPVQLPAAEGELTPQQVAEREAVTFTALDLDVHLIPDGQQISVRALLTVRNDGKSPLAHVPLQISSSLNWERIRLDGKDTVFPVATLNSDADHTGQLHEAAVPLAQPLGPGQSLKLDVTYSGKVALSARRLEAVGAPAEAARHSEWDQISLPFTGLRGFGNVVWYPVSSVPVMLGDGARLFDEMGEHKLRIAGAQFRLRLTVEFPHGQSPTVALVNGHLLSLAVTEPSSALDQSQEVNGVATADSGSTILGFEAPSLFAAIRTPHLGPNLAAWTLPEDDISVEFWTEAAGEVKPFLEGWLGRQPRSLLTLLDLPADGDAPFETGSLLATPLKEPGPKAKTEALDGALVHALTHAWFAAPDSRQPHPAWLDEGVAAFMGTLWVEKQHGREQALGTLESGRAALALAEPASPGESPGQPLSQAISPVYYRTKAAYVLWMLRDLAGDQALSAGLKANNAALPRAFEKLLEDSEAHPDLSWFFADWVDADKGLPDLSIQGVFPTNATADNWLVAVKIVNGGYAAAEVPVIVRSGSGSEVRSVSQRVRVPARRDVTARILIQGKPTEVQVNDGSVPETQASVHVTRLDEPVASPSSSSTEAKPQ